MPNNINRPNSFVQLYIEEIASRIVAKTGMPDDRFHLGKLMIQALKDDLDFIVQINGETGESENASSVIHRTIKCAACFQNLGLNVNDVVTVMGPNHLDLTIPFYAAMSQGIIIGPLDKNFNLHELIDAFRIQEPKIVFCQNDKEAEVKEALKELNLNTKVVTFDKGDDGDFDDFLNKYGDNVKIEDFRCRDIDPNETIAMLMPTSGTTGLPKAVALSHKNLAIAFPYLWSRCTDFPTPTKLCLIVSPFQWISMLYGVILGTILKITRLQSSLPSTTDHVCHLINTYKPTYAIMSPPTATSIVRAKDLNCDLTSFEILLIGGSAVDNNLIVELKKKTPNTAVVIGYGSSETCGPLFHLADYPENCVGTPMGCHLYRLVDPESQKDVTEPNVKGELWIKGPGVFKGYWKNPEATKEAMTEDGWFKSGDLLYRDENWNFFFVERLKLLLKYRNNHVSPVEIETVIRQCPGVMDVAVTGIPHKEHGDLPIAVVVLSSGSQVTEEQIKDLVKNTLTDTKQLRGGVIFVDKLPLTPSAKVNRGQLKQLAIENYGNKSL